MLHQRFGFGSKGMETGTDVGLAALCSGVISPLQLASLELFDHLASQRMRFPPAQVNDPCRSHIHPATPRVVGQPSETVLYRELQGPRQVRRGPFRLRGTGSYGGPWQGSILAVSIQRTRFGSPCPQFGLGSSRVSDAFTSSTGRG